MSKIVCRRTGKTKPEGCPKKIMGSKLKSRLKIALIAITALPLLAILAWLVFWFAVVPQIVTSRIEQAIEPHWDGTVEIGEIEVSSAGLALVHDLRLLDSAGRVHLTIPKATLWLDRGPGLDATLTRVNLDKPELRLHRVDGRFVSPLRWTETENSDSINLQSVNIADVIISLYEPGRPPERLGACSAALVRKQDSHELALSFEPKIGTKLGALLTIQRTGANEIEIRPAQTTTALHKPFHAIITWAGSPMQSASIVWQAALADGNCQGELALKFSPDKPIEYHGRIALEHVDLRQLSQMIPMGAAGESGILSGRLEFEGQGASTQSFHGRGRLVVAGLPSRTNSLTRGLLEIVNKVKGGDGLTSDLDAIFSFRGPVATIREGLLVDAIHAIKIEPGGTIDLQTRQIDLYVDSVHLQGLSDMLVGMPLMNLATIPFDKFTRLHVTGTWDDQKISKEPVADTSEAAREVLAEISRSGGSLTSSIRDLFEGFFSGLRPTQ